MVYLSPFFSIQFEIQDWVFHTLGDVGYIIDDAHDDDDDDVSIFSPTNFIANSQDCLSDFLSTKCYLPYPH